MMRNFAKDFIDQIKYRSDLDKDFFIKISSTAPNRNFRAAAFKKLEGDNDSLISVFYKTKYKSIKALCVQKIDSENILVEIAKATNIEPIKFQAAIKTNDQELLDYALKVTIRSLEEKFDLSSRVTWLFDMGLLPKIRVPDTLRNALKQLDIIKNEDCREMARRKIQKRLDDIPNTLAFMME